MKLLLTFLTLLSVSLPAPAEPPAPMAKVDGGEIRGLAEKSLHVFKGIPYAAPPVGELRWRNPQPVKAWDGVKETTAFGPASLQPGDMTKSEDCLTLNVWTPADPGKKPLPVMVWFHGGAMVRGAPQMYPLDQVAKQGAVMVSVGFRLGRLGYFAHPALAAEAPDEPRGNYGYMDQRAALQWVQRNIAAFGGDPNQVTIFGESAGGGSVMAHLASPLSRGLFHRAILQSPGTPGGRAGAIPSTGLAEAEKLADAWASSIGVTGEGAEALKQLRALPEQALIADASGEETLADLSAGTTPPGLAMSIVDGKFLTESPESALAAGRMAPVPVIIGANDRDLPIGTAADKDALFALFGPDADQARRLYDPRGDQPLAEMKQQVFADRTLVEPARHFADAMARAGNPVWLYRFAYVSEALRGRDMGTLHGFEIPFALNLPAAMVGAEKVTATDQAMADLTSAYWLGFGLTGDPNGGGRPAWPKHDPAADHLLHFTNSGVFTGSDPLKPRLDLWQRYWERSTPVKVESPGQKTSVTVFNFARAETDLYFGKYATKGSFGKLGHSRDMADIDKQDVVRMNRDTIYSSGVFDLDAAPLAVTLPDPGKRFMSMQVINQDHFTLGVHYDAGRYEFTKDKVGTRYVFILIRTLANPNDPADMTAARALQDAIRIEQANHGLWESPAWDDAARTEIRDALALLGAHTGSDDQERFGAKGQVDPIAHLIGTAIGWGGNPRSAAVYQSLHPQRNDGSTAHTLTVKDVPVDGFWSVSVYNAAGYFEKNDRGLYSLNHLTAKPAADGSFTIRFGGDPAAPNYLPICPGWNYTVRLYRSRKEILDGTWKFPAAVPAE